MAHSSIPGRVIPKTQKWYLIPPCLTLSIIRNVTKVKWSNPEKGVALFPTPRKRSLRVDYGRQFYLVYRAIDLIRETEVQSQVESYQRLKKWYLMPPCLALSIIRLGLRVKWSNPRKGVAPSPKPRCSSY